MTTKFGCCERRTMESQQPSVYNEERNILRLRAWEQRIQETGQVKEMNTENVPLFGQPYKTNKGDELSTRIQRMLGSYEDVNNPHPVPAEPLSIPTYVTFPQSDQSLTNTDKQTQPPFHGQVHYMSSQSQKAPPSSTCSAQPVTTSSASSSSSHCGHLAAFSAHQIKKSDAYSDHREQETPSQSPDVKAPPPPFFHSSDHENTEMGTKDTFDQHQLQGSTNDPSESISMVDVSTFPHKQSPKDAPQPQGNKGSTLPSQTFSSLLSSKQTSVVMTQKPTAYVRPMDGQDQVVSESPELKPSPKPYAPLPELISTSDQGKRKILPQFLETRINEAQCVEDILKEMTHSWPPLLTLIDAPDTTEPFKSPFQTKEAERVSSCPSQNPAQHIQQSSSSSLQAVHSRGEGSASSSDSESSSRSESDSESTTEEPPQPSAGNSVKPEPDAPAVTHGAWQLGNWIRSSQSSKTESQCGAQAIESPAHKQPHPTQSNKHSAVKEVDPTKELKPQVSSHQKESTDGLGKPQVCRESLQDSYNQQISQKSPSVDQKSFSSLRKLSYNTNSSKTGSSEAALDVKCEDVAVTRDKDLCFTDRPKVKTKTGHSRKSKDTGGAKRDSKRTSKHTSLDKRKAGSELNVTHNLPGHCPSCRVQYPTPCSCPTQSPAQLDHLSPAPSVRIKANLETVCQKGVKTPHKTTQKHSGQNGTESKNTPKPPRSLLVRIDLGLLSRVPQMSGNHQETHSKSKRSVTVIKQDGRCSDVKTSLKLSKTSKKSIPQNVEVENKTVPRKKQRLENNLENKNTLSSHPSAKLESANNSTENSDRKKTKKNPVQHPVKPKDSEKKTKLQEAITGETQDGSKKAVHAEDSRKKKRSRGKHIEHSHSEKSSQKLPKSSVTTSLHSTRETLTKRPLLQLQDRQYPVKHYIKEAKKLKHKADAESDKLTKAFNYLDAAMFFVESGIAMEKDPQISMSSYTMFAETVELLKFVLKLKNSLDSSILPSEKDFLALCLKCQSLLQMAMFRHKQKTALKYSKTLTDHFSISAQKTPDTQTSKSSDTPSPVSSLPSPANTFTSSGPASNHSGSGLVVDPISSTVVVPQAIEKVAFTYVNITTLFLSAHDIWEQAEELAHKGSGLLMELDAVMGPLRLTSSMSSMVRYTRQGVHWLRLDSLKVK